MSHVLEAYKRQANTVIKAFKTRNIEGYFVENIEQAKEKVLELMQENSTVSWGGSKTLDEIGIKEALSNKPYTLFDRATATTPDEIRDIYLSALGADYYLTSTNAFTSDGELVNIDGNGNRVAAIAFGPKNIIVVTGMNKLSLDVEDAFKRVQNIASPPNTIRLNKETPCAKTGFCHDCKSVDCICCTMVVTRYCRVPGRIKVILVGETLGF